MTTILVVDDDPTNQHIMTYTLRKAGYEVRAANNVQLGLDALRQEPAHLAIIDLTMPVMDGLTLLINIRADEKLRDMPVIILTASGDDDENAIAMKNGANAFLTKPSSSRTILDMVQKFLQSGL